MAVTKRKGGRRRSARAAQLPRAVDEGRESLDFYLQEISRIPLLKIEEETALARRAFKGDVEAQEKLARHNVRFVVSVAKKFQNRGVPLMDLIGEGNLGLMTAARKFDPDRGVKFISYAVWWIRQAIQAAIARHGRPVRVPLNRTADLNRLGRATVLLTERLGRVPTTEELVEATGLTRDAVRALGALHIEALRLDHPVREADDRGRMERFVPLTQEGTDATTLANSRTNGSGGRAGGAPAPGREGAPALFRAGRREEPDAGGDRPDDGGYPRADSPAPGPGPSPAPGAARRQAARARGLTVPEPRPRAPIGTRRSGLFACLDCSMRGFAVTGGWTRRSLCRILGVPPQAFRPCAVGGL